MSITNLCIDMPSILTSLLELTDNGLDTRPNDAGIIGSTVTERSQSLGHPVRRRAVVRESLDQSPKTQHGTMANNDESVVFWGRSSSARGDTGGYSRAEVLWFFGKRVL